MKEKRRCSILFHLLVPGGRWLTVMSRPSSLIRKSWTRTSSGLPRGRYSRPLLRKSPTSSFFLVSTEITGCCSANAVVREQRRILGDRSLAPSSRSPNSLGRLVLRQFLQAPPDRARCNPGRHLHRRDPAIPRGER